MIELSIVSRHVRGRIVLAAIFCVLAAWFLWGPHRALAATLYLSPASNSVKIGDTFSIGVYVTSVDQALNGYSGTLLFSKDTLEVVDLSKSGITQLWVQGPTYSNTDGVVNFEGLVLNPGFTGSGGQIITLTFKAKAAGPAQITFTESSVLANDGHGTDILTGIENANYTIVGVEEPIPVESSPKPGSTLEPESPTLTVGVPAAVSVASSTHPDQTAWYAANDVKFNWSLPSGITGVSVLVDNEPNTDPGQISDGVFSGREYANVEGGIWYFHIRLKNKNGWGDASHYVFRIDLTAPQIVEAVIVESAELPTIVLTASDDLSGVFKYKLTVDDGVPQEVMAGDLVNSEYTFVGLEPGPHRAHVVAYDAAGNASQETVIDFVAPQPAAESTLESTPLDLARVFYSVVLAIFAAMLVILSGFLLRRSRSGQVIASPINQPPKSAPVSAPARRPVRRSRR